MTTTWNFYTLYGGNVVRVPVHFLSLPLFFNLHWWLPKHFSFCTAATKFSCFCYNKKMSPLLLIYCSFALFLVELRWPAAHFLFFSVFLLFDIPICGHDNLSSKLKFFTQHRHRNNFRFPLPLLALLQEAGGYSISRQNNLELHLGYHTSWLSYFTLVGLWCGRMVSRCMVMWLPNFLGWV